MNRIRTMLSPLAAVATALIVAAAPARAAGDIQIRGVGTVATADDCAPLTNLFTMKLVGSLVGCWYTTWYNPLKSTPGGTYAEEGTETFVGCLADGITCGTFNTTYRFSAKNAPSGAEIRGRCEHPIVSGTGGFAGITGRVDFKDDVETGEFLYRGHVALR